MTETALDLISSHCKRDWWNSGAKQEFSMQRAGIIPAVSWKCWENWVCPNIKQGFSQLIKLAPDFHQSRLQCRHKSRNVPNCYRTLLPCSYFFCHVLTFVKQRKYSIEPSTLFSLPLNFLPTAPQICCSLLLEKISLENRFFSSPYRRLFHSTW